MTENTELILSVRRRDGSVVAFDRSRIVRAIALAFLNDANGVPRHVCASELMPAERDKVQRFTDQVVHALSRRPDAARHPVDIEDIQDQVELALMRGGEHVIARDYVLYREQHRKERTAKAAWSTVTA
jgi:ribonucleoside-diphosphate reductase alpha chain